VSQKTKNHRYTSLKLTSHLNTIGPTNVLEPCQSRFLRPESGRFQVGTIRKSHRSCYGTTSGTLALCDNWSEFGMLSLFVTSEIDFSLKGSSA